MKPDSQKNSEKTEPEYSILYFDNNEDGEIAAMMDEILSDPAPPKTWKQIILESGNPLPDSLKDE